MQHDYVLLLFVKEIMLPRSFDGVIGTNSAGRQNNFSLSENEGHQFARITMTFST